MARRPQVQTEPIPSETPDQSPVPSQPISFTDPVSPADQVAAVSDTAPEGFGLVTGPVTPEQMDALHAEANRDNIKADFVRKVMEARAKAAEPPPPPQPVAPAIAEQTKAEQEAGRQAVARHAEQARIHRRPAPEPQTSTAVFRPADYVPDQRKGQGYIKSQTASL